MLENQKKKKPPDFGAQKTMITNQGTNYSIYFLYFAKINLLYFNCGCFMIYKYDLFLSGVFNTSGKRNVESKTGPMKIITHPGHISVARSPSGSSVVLKGECSILNSVSRVERFASGILLGS